MRHGVGLAPVILLLVANVWCYKVCGSEPHFAVRTEDIVMLIIVFRSSLNRREKKDEGAKHRPHRRPQATIDAAPRVRLAARPEKCEYFIL
jgi:hypothetical protein